MLLYIVGIFIVGFVYAVIGYGIAWTSYDIWDGKSYTKRWFATAVLLYPKETLFGNHWNRHRKCLNGYQASVGPDRFGDKGFLTYVLLHVFFWPVRIGFNLIFLIIRCGYFLYISGNRMRQKDLV